MLGEWTEMFAKDPALGVMEQAFLKLKSQSRASSAAHVCRRSYADWLKIQRFFSLQNLPNSKLLILIDKRRRRNYN